MNITAPQTPPPEVAAGRTNQRTGLGFVAEDTPPASTARIELSSAGLARALSSVGADRFDRPLEERSLTLDYERRQESVLRLKTREGDIVQISLTDRAGLSVEERVTLDQDGTVAEIDLGAVNERRLVITVRGELSAAELAAIGEAAAQAASLANDFFAGKLDDALTAARQFGVDSDQLARVSLRLGVREELSVSQAVALAAAPLPTSGVAEAQSPDAAQAVRPVAAAVTTTAQPANAVVRPDTPVPPSPPTARPPTDDANPDPALQEAIPNLLDAFQALAELLDALGNFLNRLVAKFQSGSSPERAGNSSNSVDLRFRLALFQKVVATASVEPAETERRSNSTGYLGDLLAARAQLEDPQTLDAVA